MKEFISGQESRELGTMENPIVDSSLTKDAALRPNPNFSLSLEVFERQIILEVIYMSFEGKFHKGQIVIDKELENDVRDFFNFLLEQKFPIDKMIPVADEKFNFNDVSSMEENNSSAFNPRNIAGTKKPSNHAFGRAIDVNPRQNPWIKNEITLPDGAVYDIEKPGTFTPEIAEFLKKRRWTWGGDFKELKDYHHFEKALEETI